MIDRWIAVDSYPAVSVVLFARTFFTHPAQLNVVPEDINEQISGAVGVASGSHTASSEPRISEQSIYQSDSYGRLYQDFYKVRWPRKRKDGQHSRWSLSLSSFFCCQVVLDYEWRKSWDTFIRQMKLEFNQLPRAVKWFVFLFLAISDFAAALLCFSFL